jgi:hypothetical protein
MSKLLHAILGDRPSEGLSMTPDAQFERLSANLRRAAHATAQTPSVDEQRASQHRQMAHALPHLH